MLNLRNGLGLANVDRNTQTGVIGALLILSVLVPKLVGRVSQRAPRRAGSTSGVPPAADGQRREVIAGNERELDPARN